MAIRVLVVLDGVFSFETYPSDRTPKFSYTVLVNALTDAGMTVTKAHRGNDTPYINGADHTEFRFDGVIDLNRFDVLWLIGDSGNNQGSDEYEPRLEDTELAAIKEFMDSGRGVFATGDHDGIGSHMCGWIQRVRVMRRWFRRNETAFPMDLPSEPGATPTISNNLANYDPLSVNRADTIQDSNSDSVVDFSHQSDAIPQPIVVDIPGHGVHPIFERSDGSPITIFPDHMHEGECIDSDSAGEDATSNALDGYGWPTAEFPSGAGGQEQPRVIATGAVGQHLTTYEVNDSFDSFPVSIPRSPHGIMSAYDGFPVGVGRLVTGATFHHYVDLNLTGDPRVDAAAAAVIGEEAASGYEHSSAGTVLDDLRTVYVNITRWLARPPRQLQLVLDRSTFGENEVAINPDFPASFFATVDGYRPSDFAGGGITSLDLGDFQTAWAPALVVDSDGITVTPVRVYSDNTSLPDAFQRFTFEYDVSIDSDVFDEFAEMQLTSAFTATASLTTSGVTLSQSGTVLLVKGANPFMRDVDPPNGHTRAWLSTDVRVFSAISGQSAPFGLPALPSGADYDGALNYLRSTVLPAMTVSQFESLPVAAGDAPLSLFEKTDGDSGRPIFNFAIARVRVRAGTGIANDVRVYFRLFKYVSMASLTYQTIGGEPQFGYLRNASRVPLPGVARSGNEYISYPCFAQRREANREMQPDVTNEKTLNSGAVTDTFYGCLLDNNLNRNYLQLDPRNESDPDVPLSEHMMGSHQCLVAQVDFLTDGIPSGANPATSDKLSQRNLVVEDIENPGGAGSRSIAHPFEIEAIGTRTNARPDELMLTFSDDVPSGAKASVYIPSTDADHVVRLARKMYTVNRLRTVDDHTISCPAEGKQYIPLPANRNRQAALISMDFPTGVRKGQHFEIVVRQITTKTRKVSIGPAEYRNVTDAEAKRIREELKKNPTADVAIFNDWSALNAEGKEPFVIETKGAEAARRALARPWRETVGVFHYSVPVNMRVNMLRPAERLLSMLYWRNQKLDPQSRWTPVHQRYLEHWINKVRALGGNPFAIPASPSGTIPGDGQGADGDDHGRPGDGQKPDCPPMPPYGDGESVPPWQDGTTANTGKVVGIAYNHFGDFSGFTIERFDGSHRHFLARAQAHHDLVTQAWKGRYVVSVMPLPADDRRVSHIVLRATPTDNS